MKKILFIPIIVLAVVGGSYLFLNGKADVSQAPAESELTGSEVDTADIIDSEEVALQNEQEARLNKVNENIGEAREYKNTEHGFSLVVPAGYKVAEYGASFEGSEDARVVVITGEDSRSGFQIMISNYEGDKLDLPTIQAELPEMTINKAVNATIGKEARGVAFESNNSSFDGSSFEIWFARAGKLYQASSYLDQRRFVESVFQSFSFY